MEGTSSMPLPGMQKVESLSSRLRHRHGHAIVSNWLAQAPKAEAVGEAAAQTGAPSDDRKGVQLKGFAGQGLPAIPLVQVVPPQKLQNEPQAPSMQPPALGLDLPYANFNLDTIRSEQNSESGDSSNDDGQSTKKEDDRRISACSNLMSLEGIKFEVLSVYNKSRKSTLKRLWMGAGGHGGSSRMNSQGSLKGGPPSGNSRIGSHRMSLAAGQVQDLTRERSQTINTIIMEDEDEDPTCRQRCAKAVMIHPNARGRAIWDLLSLALVTYDTITIPMELLNPKDNIFTSMMAWITRIFWTFDMPASFFTGFVTSNGAVEMRLRPVVRRYVRSWLLLDILVVTVDWFEVFATVHSSLGYARVGKASRIFRILRLIRLMRLIKMGQVVRLLTERIFSEFLIIVFDIIKSLMIIVGVAHLAACIWYGIGAAPDPHEKSWMNEMPMDFVTMDLAYRYSTVLHWSLSQFSGGMSEMSPQNAWERFYNIICYLLAFVVAAIFVSSLTSSMTRLIVIGSQQSTQTALLRRYLFQNNISSGLAWRIQRNASFAISEREKNMPESQIELLQIISGPLRVELHFEIFSPVLSRHRFFVRYTEECPQVMRKVCHGALSIVLVSHGDVIFSVGEFPSEPKVYFPKSGELEYMKMDGETSLVDSNIWVAEAVLWTSWTHRGQLTAAMDCSLSVVMAKAFQEIVVEFEHHMFDPKMYAAEFVADLNRCEQVDITDLPFTEAQGHFGKSLRRYSALSEGSCGSDSSHHSGRPSEGTRGLVQEVASIIQIGVHRVEEKMKNQFRRFSNASDAAEAAAQASSRAGSSRPSLVSRIASAPTSQAGSRRPSFQNVVVPNFLGDAPLPESQYGNQLTIKKNPVIRAAST